MPDKFEIDPSIPQSVVRDTLQEQPNPALWTDDLVALFSTNVEARPLHMPSAMKIREIKNTDYKYYWARDMQGRQPQHSRVGELKWIGGDFAEPWNEEKKSGDVIMENGSTILGPGEIRCGDLILMKIPLHVWQSVRKQQQMDALHQTKRSNKDRSAKETLMSTQTLLSRSGVPTQLNVDDSIIDRMRDSKVSDDASRNESTIENFIRGNTTKVPSPKTEK